MQEHFRHAKKNQKGALRSKSKFLKHIASFQIQQ